MNYAQLIQELQRQSQDYSSDLQLELPSIIDQGERLLSKDLNVDAMAVRTSAAMTAGTFIYDKPALTIAIRYIYFTPVGGGARTFLEYRRREAIMDYAPNPTAAASRGEPKFWDNYDTGSTSQIYIGPSPDDDYPYVVESEVRLNGLSSTTTETWWSINQPDVLISACMKGVATWQKNPAMQARWDKIHTERVALTVSEIAREDSDATSVRRIK